MVEIIYMEDDDNEPRRTTPRSLPQSQGPSRIHSYRPPVSSGAGHFAAWFICTNDSCPRAGHVATGKNDPTHIIKRGRCGACRGLGIRVDEGGDVCDTCRGSGRRVISEHDEVLPVRCPHCRQPMEFLQEGAFPVGYPRMETPHSDKDDPNFKGEAKMGRTRIVSDG